jgi:hypothetical protein
MTKNKRPKQSKSKDEQYLLIWAVKFTVLEEFILKVITKEVACSDETIAAMLYLNLEDVADIIADERLGKYVEGDKSRRTLVLEQTKKEFLICSDGQHESTNRTVCNERQLTFLEGLETLKINTLKKELKEQKAEKYYKLSKDNQSEWDSFGEID